jgi:tRNA(Ile)-lysidine synthase
MIYVGFSGGIDSMVLLHQLKQHHTSITAIHVNHHISKNAGDWEKFCKEYCESNNIGIVIKHVHLKTVTEDEARQHRYKAFKQTCDEIYLAHHQDDDIETMMFKMIRGCGVAGLKGIGSKTQVDGFTIHRPMLEMSKQQIKQYATQHNLSWVTDESNECDDYSRNFLRNNIIPMLKKKFPMFSNSMQNLKQHMIEADDLMVEIAQQDVMQTQMEIKKIRELSSTRRRNLVRYYIKKRVGNLPPSKQFNEFVRQIETSITGSKTRLKIGTCVLGIQNSKLTQLSHSDV